MTLSELRRYELPHRTLRRFGAALCLASCAFAGLTALTLERGQTEMQLSDRHFHQSDLVRSIAYAQRAAALYVPGAPHVRAARERLLAIAVGSERAGDRATAAAALRAARAALLLQRHAWTSDERALREVERALERVASHPSSRATSPDSLEPDAHPPYAAQRFDPPRPALRGSLFASFGLAIGGAVWLAFRALDPSRKFEPRGLLLPLAGCAVAVIGWALALLLA